MRKGIPDKHVDHMALLGLLLYNIKHILFCPICVSVNSWHMSRQSKMHCLQGHEFPALRPLI